jgi:acyl transferase domain-containing protein
MSRPTSRLQRVLYPVFLVTCTSAAAIGLLAIWGVEPSRLMGRLLGTCVVLAVASAFTMSATRLVAGRAPEDGDD